MLPFKNKSGLKKQYTIFLEVGLILSLLVFLALVKLPIHEAQSKEIAFDGQKEIIEMEEIERTQQEERVPPPPQPQVPIEVPNDEIIEEQEINIDADINMNEPLDIPPPPPNTAKEEADEEEEDFFVAVEQMPELIGGIKALQKKINYPERARKSGIEGRVIIQFIVNEQGEVKNPKVIRGIGGGCDEEALRVVKQAKFKPGKQRGRPVRVQYSLPIIFQLQR